MVVKENLSFTLVLAMAVTLLSSAPVASSIPVYDCEHPATMYRAINLHEPHDCPSRRPTTWTPSRGPSTSSRSTTGSPSRATSAALSSTRRLPGADSTISRTGRSGVAYFEHSYEWTFIEIHVDKIRGTPPSRKNSPTPYFFQLEHLWRTAWRALAFPLASIWCPQRRPAAPRR